MIGFILWLCWFFIAAQGLSLVGVSRGPLFLVVSRLLMPVASLEEHGLLAHGLQ